MYNNAMSEERISISDDLREKMGPEVADQFERWFEVENDVLIISPEILEASRKTGGPFNRREMTDIEKMRHYFQDATGIKIPLNDRSAEQLQEFIDMVEDGGARIQTVTNAETGQVIYMVLSTGRIGRTAVESAARISAIQAEHLENIPGTGRDWFIMTQLHEAGHGNAHSEHGTDLDGEVDADQNIVNNVSEEVERGLISDPEVAKAYLAMRALRFHVRADMGEHQTNAMIDLPGEGPAFDSDQKAMRLGWEHAKSKIFAEMGDFTGDPLQAKLNPLRLPNHDFLKTDQYRDIANALLEGDESKLNEFLETLTPEQRAIYNEEVHQWRMVDFLDAHKLAQEQPELFYQTARRLYLEGAFDDNREAKQFVYEYLDSARKYAPTYYGANPDEVIPAPTGDEPSTYVAPETTNDASPTAPPPPSGPNSPPATQAPGKP